MNASTSPQSYTAIVGAGLTLNIAVAGSQFYFPVATGQLWARPTRGQWAIYQAGTGQDFGAAGMFYEVQIQNPNSFPMVFQIVASATPFIDKRLVPNQPSTNVINSYAPAAWSAVGEDFQLKVDDLSGQTFKDASGTVWNAISRVSLTIQNNSDVLCAVAVGSFDSTVIANLQSASGGPVESPFTLNASGDFYLSYGPAEAVPVTVFEIYQAVQPGYAATPPS